MAMTNVIEATASAMEPTINAPTNPTLVSLVEVLCPKKCSSGNFSGLSVAVGCSPGICSGVCSAIAPPSGRYIVFGSQSYGLTVDRTSPTAPVGRRRL